MITRRGFAGLVAAGFTEFAFAQRSAVDSMNVQAPKGTVWLNANEFPEGPPAAALDAIARAAKESNRYHFTEYPAIYQSIASIEGLKGDQVLVGAGSTEALHCAVEAFTSPKRPFICAWPTFESGPELAAAQGHAVVKLPLTSDYRSDVRQLVAEAKKAGGGMIYICNPNNPTGNVAPKQDIGWAVRNLPADTVLLIDEAYFHFNTSPETESAMKYVKDGKNVLVMRTFSKIYGMAGLRAGYVAARPDLIKKMAPFRNLQISITTARAVVAAIDMGPKLVEERRARLIRTRDDLVAFLKQKKLNTIESQANFVMFDTGRDINQIGPAMLAKGVAVGRPFPPYNTMMRITIGTDAEMAKFKAALSEVLSV
ncbi:MAG TPA: aminotransferase class I/II-fold pyridoxal phosphate-dependent enzyme [Bryobacteraceae bacterium]|jgi:histidinol-phosphate aminotransferase|nr:aminotransferase class I/II-fold pyridoxal phosphate-dependent enzyme [Bryobacteraceae bacterium]